MLDLSIANYLGNYPGSKDSGGWTSTKVRELHFYVLESFFSSGF